MPIVGVSTADIDERANAFNSGADFISRSAGFNRVLLQVDQLALRVAAESYFFLSEAYKVERIPMGSRTKLPKIAAMTALALGRTQPFRPTSLSVNEEEHIYVNGALAMRMACSLVSHRFDKRPFDDRRRWYKLIQGLELPSIAPIINEARNMNALTSTFTPSLTEDELCKIDSLVESFCIMELLGDHDASHR